MSSALSLPDESGRGRLRRWVLRPISAALSWRGMLILLVLVALVGAGIAGVAWPVVGAVALAVMAVGLVVTVRGDGAEILGPICWYDLIRLARQRRTLLLRCLYPVVLLLVLYHIYGRYFPDYDLLVEPFHPATYLAPSRQAEIGRGFVTAILMIQALAVLLLTPVYLAGAVAQERERRTLELLFTTHLRDHEIVVGKLVSRLGHLAIALLSSVPLLVLVEIFGGVDVAVVLGGSAAALLCLLSVGGLSMLCSTLFRKTLFAVLATYVFCGVLYIGGVSWYGLSPIAFVRVLEERIQLSAGSFTPGGAAAAPAVAPLDVLWPMLIPCAVVHISLALAAGSLAVLGVRVLRRYEPVGRARVRRRRPPQPGIPRRPAHHPPIGGQPLLWKEIHIGPRGNPWFRTLVEVLRIVGGILVGLLALEAVTCYLLDKTSVYESLRVISEDSWPVVRQLPRLLAVLFTAAWGLSAAYQASSSVGEERDRGTLDGLLTLPVPRRDILSAKWYGSILRTRFPGYFLAAVWVLGLLMGFFDPPLVLLLPIAGATYLMFLTSLGIWLSVVCRKTLTANLTVALLVTVVWPAAWWWTASGSPPRQPIFWDQAFTNSFCGVALNPLRSTWVLGFSRENSPFRETSWRDDLEREVVGDPDYFYFRSLFGQSATRPIAEILAAVAGVPTFAFLSAVFWRLACWRFDRRPQRKRALAARLPRSGLLHS